MAETRVIMRFLIVLAFGAIVGASLSAVAYQVGRTQATIEGMARFERAIKVANDCATSLEHTNGVLEMCVKELKARK